jgi:hypothetical protein
VIDDRDWSWLQRSAPAVPDVEEHPLWQLQKRAHSVDARVRATPGGPELRILVDGELWWSQLFQPATEAGIAAAAERKRDEFEAKGWAP